MATRAECEAYYAKLGKGPQVGPSPDVADIDGEQTDRRRPEEYAKATGLPLEVYSLARCIGSEGYGGKGSPVEAYAAVGWAIRNRATRAEQSITARLTWDSDAGKGLYGEQRERMASTARAPRRLHVMVAEGILGGAVTDRTKGASAFFDPKVQDGGMQGGKAIKPTETILKNWAADGYEWVGRVAGIDTYHLALFRKGRRGTAELVALLPEMRARGGDIVLPSSTEAGPLLAAVGLGLAGLLMG